LVAVGHGILTFMILVVAPTVLGVFIDIEDEEMEE
jgi:hypothetical protein